MYTLARDTIIASGAYVATFFFTFTAWMPIQNAFFPDFHAFASLLFLPHGVRVLSAWLLGWRSVLVLLPGVIFTYAYLGGMNVFMPSRMAGIAISVLVTPLVFQVLKSLGKNLYPDPDRDPCWTCVMGVGLVSAILSGVVTNLAFGSPPMDYFAFFIGDVAGLFFVMLFLMLFFRFLRMDQES
jgi:hypothetical protein